MKYLGLTSYRCCTLRKSNTNWSFVLLSLQTKLVRCRRNKGRKLVQLIYIHLILTLRIFGKNLRDGA